MQPILSNLFTNTLKYIPSLLSISTWLKLQASMATWSFIFNLLSNFHTWWEKKFITSLVRTQQWTILYFITVTVNLIVVRVLDIYFTQKKIKSFSVNNLIVNQYKIFTQSRLMSICGSPQQIQVVINTINKSIVNRQCFTNNMPGGYYFHNERTSLVYEYFSNIPFYSYQL